MQTPILDHPFFNERYFFPRDAQVPEPFWVENGDVRLSCYYHLRNEHPEAKTVIYFHGNGEVVSDYMELFVPLFEQLGYNLLLAEYRGYSMSTGTPALVTMMEDVEKVIEAVQLPPERIVLYGRSIGSLFVTQGVWKYPDIAGLIIESGIAVLLERVLMRLRPEDLGVTMEQLEQEIDTHFNHPEKLKNYKGKTLVMHARNDSLVHCAHGQKLHEWAPEPKQLKIFEQGDHNDIFYVNADDYFKTVFEFLGSL